MLLIVENSPVDLGELRFADYSVVEKAGESETSVTFKAAHRVIKDRFRAIKTFQASSQMLRDWLAPSALHRLFGAFCATSARLAQAVDSAAGGDEKSATERIVRIDTIHFDPEAEYSRDESYYLISEWIPGGTLADRLRDGPVPAERAASIGISTLETLQFAHAHDIVHGNLKPSNILFTADDSPRIVDFGGNVYGPGIPFRAGSVPYLGPEYEGGTAEAPIEIDARADLFSVSLILYEMLCGRRAPRCLTSAELPSRLQPGVGTAWDELILHGLQTDRECRYSSAAEMRERLMSTMARPAAARQWAEQTTIDPGLEGESSEEFEAVEEYAPPDEGGPTNEFEYGRAAAASEWKPRATPTRAARKRVTVSEPPPVADEPVLPAPPPVVTMRPGERRVNEIDEADLVWVPGGTLSMGGEDSEAERPVHAVEVAGFWIYRYPVTQGQYMQYIRQMREQVGPEAAPSRPGLFFRGDDHRRKAAAGVQWKEARLYGEWAGARLPTEAEWEWAARGPEGSRYPWGDSWDPSRANTQETGLYEQTEGDRFGSGKSWCDAYDLIGNVFEWCSSLYMPYPYDPNDGREDGATPGERVLRGGSATTPPPLIRSSARFTPSAQTTLCGFRLVKAG